MTGVSWWGHKVDNAYWLWNFQGKILKRSSVEKFCQLVWRPRFGFHESIYAGIDHCVETARGRSVGIIPIEYQITMVF